MRLRLRLGWSFGRVSVIAERAAESWRPLQTKSSVTEADIVAEYLEIALHGARPDDLRLAVLSDATTNEELQRPKEAIRAKLLRREPVPPKAN
jgi:hypothetical protein